MLLVAALPFGGLGAEFPYERTGIEETEVRLAFLSGMQEHIKIAAGENLSELSLIHISTQWNIKMPELRRGEL